MYVCLIRMNFACPYCGKKNDRVDNQLAQEYDDCCPGKPSDKVCMPDNAPRNFRNDIAGCEKFRLVSCFNKMSDIMSGSDLPTVGTRWQ